MDDTVSFPSPPPPPHSPFRLELGSPYDRHLCTCINLAYSAGSMAMDFLNKWRLNHESMDIEEKKNDEGPVTRADKMLNDFICTTLTSQFPDARVIGEESVISSTSHFDVGQVFFVDPIDGTKEFIRDNGEWAVMIGMTVDGVPTVGVVHQPSIDTMRFAVKDFGSYAIYKNSTPPVRLQCHTQSQVDEQTTIVTSRNTYSTDVEWEQLVCEIGIQKRITYGSFGLKTTAIAERKADVYINLAGATSYWDTCAPELILHEAGGTLLRDNGLPLSYHGPDTHHRYSMIATTASLAPVILSVVQRRLSNNSK